MVGIAGGSPTKPTEVALLEVDGVEGLLASQPAHWQALRKASNMEVQTRQAFENDLNSNLALLAEPGMVEAKSHSEWPTKGLSRGTPDPGRQA